MSISDKPSKINALDYFKQHARDGRAMLKPAVRQPREGAGRPAELEGWTWLIRVKDRLILCVDSEYPALRFVEDWEPIFPHWLGGYRL